MRICLWLIALVPLLFMLFKTCVLLYVMIFQLPLPFDTAVRQLHLYAAGGLFHLVASTHRDIDEECGQLAFKM